MYNSKGKVKYVWSYECNDQGKLLPPEGKDTTLICRWDEYDNDGFLYKVERKVDEKGQMIKRVQKYTPDTLLVETAAYNINDVPLFIYRYLPGGFPHLHTETIYYRKGKKRSHYKWEYNDEGLKTRFSIIDKHDQVRSEVSYNYDEEGRLLSEKRWHKKPENITRNINYEYDANGYMTKRTSYLLESRYAKGNKPVLVKKFEYEQ